MQNNEKVAKIKEILPGQSSVCGETVGKNDLTFNFVINQLEGEINAVNGYGLLGSRS